jgi:hypothetical protein
VGTNERRDADFDGPPTRVRGTGRLRHVVHALLVLSGVALLIGSVVRGDWLTLALCVVIGAVLTRLWS